MKKIHLIYAALIIGVAIFWSGCSKNDDPQSGPEQKITMPKDAYRMQFVEAQFSEPLLEEEYDADLGGVALKLARLDDNTLVLYVPGDMQLGKISLTIPELNVSHALNIKNATLEGDATTVLEPFFEEISVGHQQIEDVAYASYLSEVNTAFKEYYQTLSPAEISEMALFYQVNKAFLAEILNPEYGAKTIKSLSGFETKGVKEAARKAVKFAAATYVFATCSAALVNIGTPVEKAIVGAIAVTGAVKAWDYGEQLVDEIRVVRGITQSLWDDLTGVTALNTSTLPFFNEQSKNVSFYTSQQNLSSEARSSTASSLLIFFKAFDVLTSTTHKVNDVITFINDHVFFANISLIPVQEIPAAAQPQNKVLTVEDYNSLEFTVADANVQLSDVVYENGTIRMKMTVKNPNAVTGNSLKTTLNYTYQNEFSNASGSMPIEVRLEEDENDFSLAGNWNFVKLTMIGGDFDSFTLNETQTEYYYDCPSLISYISKLTGASVSFTESSFAVNMQFYEKYFGGVEVNPVYGCSYTGAPEEGNFYWNINANYNNQSFEENGILHYPIIEGGWSYINSEDEGTTPLTGDYIKIINENKIECHLSVEFFEDGEQEDVSIILELIR